jgi:hypothetical protein
MGYLHAREAALSPNPCDHAEQFVIPVTVAAVRKKELRHQKQESSPAHDCPDNSASVVVLTLQRGSTEFAQNCRQTNHWLLPGGVVGLGP